MGEVLPFPLARRRRLLQQQVRFLRTLSVSGAERALARQLANQRRALQRRGMSPAAVEAQIAGLERAIRCELAHRCRDGVA